MEVTRSACLIVADEQESVRSLAAKLRDAASLRVEGSIHEGLDVAIQVDEQHDVSFNSRTVILHPEFIESCDFPKSHGSFLNRIAEWFEIGLSERAVRIEHDSPIDDSICSCRRLEDWPHPAAPQVDRTDSCSFATINRPIVSPSMNP